MIGAQLTYRRGQYLLSDARGDLQAILIATNAPDARIEADRMVRDHPLNFPVATQNEKES